jgi:EAL domain-containing protein (putative c-di-GMP-specific phosphodiesterase class I)
MSWVKRRFADWAGGGKLGSIRQICFDLGIDIIAEGIEAEEEYAWLGSQRIHLFPPVHYSGP